MLIMREVRFRHFKYGAPLFININQLNAYNASDTGLRSEEVRSYKAPLGVHIM
jgi:hypothetical protein